MTVPPTSATTSTARPWKRQHRSQKRPLTAICFLIAGLVIGVVIAVTMKDGMLPQAGATQALKVLWGIAIAVLVSGILIACRDILWIAREWSAVSRLATTRDTGQVVGRWPGSIIAGRIEAVDRAGATQQMPREFRQTHRARATIRSSGIGAITRFLASALLVLAVMGTFAGMKTALPPLIQAIRTAAGDLNLTSQPSGETSNSDSASQKIGVALAQVADAFGANLAALFGSLLLGGAAFGATLDKRALLAEMEHVSEELLYIRLPADADATELQKAVYEMRQSVSEVANVAGGIDQLSATIDDLRVALRDTLAELHTSFRDSVRQNTVELGTQLNTTVAGLAANLAGATKALEMTALSYEGLLKGLEERDLGVRDAAAELQRSASGFNDLAGRLEECTSAAVDANLRAAAAVDDAQALLADAARSGAEASEKLTEAVRKQEATLDEVVSALRTVQDWCGALRRQLVQMTERMEEQLEATNKASTASTEVVRDAIGQLSQAGRALGDQIVAGQQEGASLLSESIASAVAEEARNAESLCTAIALHTKQAEEGLAVLQSALNTTSERSAATSKVITNAMAGVREELALLRRDMAEIGRLAYVRTPGNGKEPVA